MNNARTSSLRAPITAALLAVTVLMPGCKSDPTDPPATITISDTDATDLFAMAAGSQSGGMMMLLGDALSVVHGGQFPARPEKRKGASVLRDTAVDRNRTVTVDGKTYAINYKVRYNYSYTNNGFNNPKDYWFEGNTELKCLPTMAGTINVPKMTGTDSAWAQILINNTDSALYTFNGKYGRIGTYTFPGVPNKTYTGKIETALIPGVRVDPTTKEIVDGDIQVTLRGTSSDGARVDWAGTYMFRKDQAPRLNVNGKYYTLDTKKGEATKQ